MPGSCCLGMECILLYIFLCYNLICHPFGDLYSLVWSTSSLHFYPTVEDPWGMPGSCFLGKECILFYIFLCYNIIFHPLGGIHPLVWRTFIFTFVSYCRGSLGYAWVMFPRHGMYPHIHFSLI